MDDNFYCYRHAYHSPDTLARVETRTHLGPLSSRSDGGSALHGGLARQRRLYRAVPVSKNKDTTLYTDNAGLTAYISAHPRIDRCSRRSSVPTDTALWTQYSG